MAIKSKNFLVFLIIFSLFSCSKDEAYDKEKAVSAFYQIDPLAVNQENQEVIIEPQKSVRQWNYGENFHQNGRVGNFKKEFSYKKNKISLKKLNSIYLDFDLMSKSDHVFLPVIDGQKIFFLGDSGVIIAYDQKTAKKVWKKRIFDHNFLESYKNPKIFGFGDKIFAISGTNEVTAINKGNGSILWKNKLPSLLISKPISDGELIYIASDKNELYAINVDDGKVVWTHSGILKNTAIFGAADPLVYSDKVFASYSSGEIYALNKSNGQEIWSFDLNLSKAIDSDFYLNDIDATPIVNNGVIYVAGNGGLMMAIDIINGDVIWKKQIATIIDFHLAGNFLYIINNDNKLIALNKKTGDIKWLKQLEAYENPKKPQTKIIYNGLVMAGDKLLVSNSLGKMLIYSPINGYLEKEIKVGKKNFHNMIIIDDKIFIHKSGFFGRYFTALK